ncbi:MULTISPECIES: phosphopantetheine-binding protein [Pseudonocardia]|uniref:L-glutamyl-[BtrI acyl-carrier protein] decarboxylase n=2 Tax=Pseudonocardia TaxID=1847 RepID=A0A1Y2N5R8_PSEAH|nr:MULTISPECIES: phosphopantetheine-binding protein [Pseudonocardia]OSY42820.1 L-glutamyl-[BtrI acyl-carrier protein] decarboxylase [Pseudonocardia autotrophica]TDN77397.1 diaminopimelate decarboxylase [Pseudonocardia autotrophica]BBG01421.1 hypothetical protein Pdca_26300 [Pseudonocardia autotrophica]GEC24477.1 hypothetical protein PSA01_15060 [Pseudonocardia saturnea]
MIEYDALPAIYGSPAYVYDLDRVDRARAELVESLPAGATLLYSLKANPHVAVVRTLVEGGCRPEISSTGELAAALQGGGEPAGFVYTGPGKTAGEIAAALDAGVRTFSVESPTDLRRVAGIARGRGVTARCLLRVNGAEAAGHAGMRMTGAASQFGTDAELLAGMRAELTGPDTDGARIVGFHFFPVTNAIDGDALLAELLGSIRTADRLRTELGVEVTQLDLGGGFACPFATPGERPRYPGLRVALEAELDTRFPGWRTGEVEVAFESGRHLVGDSGTLLCSVSDVKHSRGTRFVVLDAGINHLGGLSGIGRLLPLSATPLAGAPVPGPADAPADGPGEPTRLVGPLCTPADTLGRGATELPPVTPGQVLAIPNVGAYGATASLIGFLSRPGAVEIAVRGAEVVSATRLELVRTPVTAAGTVPAAAPDTATGTATGTAGSSRTDAAAGANDGANDGTNDGTNAGTTGSVNGGVNGGGWDPAFPAVLRSVLPRLAGSDAEVGPDDSLRVAGLDSLALVEVLVRLEETYAVTIPDELLTPEVFETPRGLWTLLGSVRA